MRKSSKGKDLHIEFIARGILLRGPRILLCQNLKHGYFYLPGGHIEFSESAAAAAEREFFEETGKRVRAGELVLASETAFKTAKKPHHEFNLVFLLEPLFLQNVRIRSREPHIGFEWVDLAAVPDLDLRPTSIKAWIASQAGGAGAVGIEFVSEMGGD